MSRALTVVYTINDSDAFEEHQQFINLHFEKSDGKPWAITAQSLGHEIHRVCLAEEAHDQRRYDLLDEIFGMIDPTICETLADVNGYNGELS